MPGGISIADQDLNSVDVKHHVYLSQQLFGLRHSDEYVYEFWARMYEEQITTKVVFIFFIF